MDIYALVIMIGSLSVKSQANILERRIVTHGGIEPSTFGLKFDAIYTNLASSADISTRIWLVGWLVVLRINVDLAILQPYLDFEA